jgi:hypothetical protein
MGFRHVIIIEVVDGQKELRAAEMNIRCSSL